jgi:hypothetical protein
LTGETAHKISAVAKFFYFHGEQGSPEASMSYLVEWLEARKCAVVFGWSNLTTSSRISASPRSQVTMSFLFKGK